MSNFHLNNSKLPRNGRFTQQIGAKARSWSSFGQIDGPFHSLSRCGSARLSEPRKQRGGGGGRDFQSRRLDTMDTDSHKIQQMGRWQLMFGFGLLR